MYISQNIVNKSHFEMSSKNELNSSFEFYNSYIPFLQLQSIHIHTQIKQQNNQSTNPSNQSQTLLILQDKDPSPPSSTQALYPHHQ